LTLPSSPKSGKKFKVERSRKYLLFPNGGSDRSGSKPENICKNQNGVSGESGELVTFEDEGLTLRQQFSEEDSSIVEKTQILSSSALKVPSIRDRKGCATAGNKFPEN
jgi:hypothetical protein